MKNRLAKYVGTQSWSEEPDREFGNILSFPCGESEWRIGITPKPSHSLELVRGLLKKLSGKSSENTELREKIDEQAERLYKLEQFVKGIFEPTNLPAYGNFEKWLMSGELTRPYRGKHVAFIAEKGVIASSDSLDELVESVEKQGKTKGLTIGFVPITTAFVSKC